jgi:hypothetical protein
MAESDPHIHVDVSVIHKDALTRDMIASTFGLVGDLPSVIATGCGQQVPYAMTSSNPTHVTCLPCREHAHHQHLRYAEIAENHSLMPGSSITTAQARQAAEQHRHLAKKFANLDP